MESIARHIAKQWFAIGLLPGLLIARTDGRTNGRTTHLPEISFSFVTRTNRAVDKSISIGEVSS